jgi:hypothetical protein
MKTFHVEASRVIDARPEDIYAVISDYRVGHPAILPKPYFTDLVVEKGGQGAGTVLRVYLSVFGRKFTYHQVVTEPEPGRVLVETDIETGQYSSFTFEPLTGGQQTRLTISSEFPAKPGLAGFMDSLTQPPFIRRLYQQELKNIADYVRQHSTVGVRG